MHQTQMHDTPRLEGVGGKPVPTLRHADVNVGIGDGEPIS